MENFMFFVQWTIPSQLFYYILHELLIIHSFISYLLFLQFIQAFYTYRAIHTKDNLFIFDNGVFDGFLNIFFTY